MISRETLYIVKTVHWSHVWILVKSLQKCINLRRKDVLARLYSASLKWKVRFSLGLVVISWLGGFFLAWHRYSQVWLLFTPCAKMEILKINFPQSPSNNQSPPGERGPCVRKHHPLFKNLTKPTLTYISTLQHILWWCYSSDKVITCRPHSTNHI